MRHSNIVLVVSISGGKDSSAMLAYLRHQYPGVRVLAVMADTGFEHVKSVTAEEWARQICAQFGVELHVVRNPNKTYLEMVRRRGKFPAPALRQCTSDLKRDPINTWIRRAAKSGLLIEKIIINCTGIRAEESANRAKQQPLRRNRRMSVNGRIVWDWMPIFRWTLQQVLDYHATHCIPLHPVYIWAGGYLKRFSCRVCIFMGVDELRAVHEHDREAFEMVAQVERDTGFTMKPGGNLYQITGIIP